MSISFIRSILTLGSFRILGLFLYLLVQYLLYRSLSSQDYASFIAFNSLSMLLGQVSTAGIDGKLVSNFCLGKGFQCTPIVLKSLFEYLPFSLLAVFLFVFLANASLFGLGYATPNLMEIFFVVSVCLLQPLLSTLQVLADKSSRAGISDFINVAPWFFRSCLLLFLPILLGAFRSSLYLSLDLVFLIYISSSFLVLCIVFLLCRARLFDIIAALLSQSFLLFRSPRAFSKLFAGNFIYLMIGFCASAPPLLAPMILRRTSVTEVNLYAFSLAFVILGFVQSCGSQFLLRTSVRKIVLYGRRVSLFLALRRSFYSVWPLLLIYGMFVIVLAFIAFSPSSLPFYSLDVKAMRFLFLMSLGLFPSAIVSLWHALFNVRRFLAFNVASRLLSLIFSVITIASLATFHGALGASVGLALSPLITVLSFSLVVFCFQGLVSAN